MREMPLWALALAVLVATALNPADAAADTVVLAQGDSVQAAIDAATPGDVIQLLAGEFVGDVDYVGKAVTVLGSPGWTSVLRGTGGGPVVRFVSGEGPTSVLEGVTVTGGSAVSGGGIFISAASPHIVGNKVFNNRASSSGSGIHVTQSRAIIANNVVVYNRKTANDPHSVQVLNASPIILNNTILRGDSNGLFLSGGATAAIVLNNILALNAGRGICNFTADSRIYYNTFHRNRKAALLMNGQNWSRVERAQDEMDGSTLFGNQDGNPGFEMSIRKGVASDNNTFQLASDALARDAGHPHPFFDDHDGTRNDVGVTGGFWGIVR